MKRICLTSKFPSVASHFSVQARIKITGLSISSLYYNYSYYCYIKNWEQLRSFKPIHS